MFPSHWNYFSLVFMHNQQPYMRYCLQDADAVKEMLSHLLRSIVAVTFQPPSDRLGKTADSDVKGIIMRHIIFDRYMFVKYLTEIFFQIAKKYFSALSAE